LPNCNLFTQHVLFILWRDTTSELWTLVLFPSYCYHLFTLLAVFTLLAYYCHFPLDMLITFVSSKPVRLTTSSQFGSKVLGCVVCRFRVAASKQSLDEAPYINYPKLSQASKHHLQSYCLLFSWTINLGFLTEGKFAAILITPSSWGYQWAGHSPCIKQHNPIWATSTRACTATTHSTATHIHLGEAAGDRKWLARFWVQWQQGDGSLSGVKPRISLVRRWPANLFGGGERGSRGEHFAQGGSGGAHQSRLGSPDNGGGNLGFIGVSQEERGARTRQVWVGLTDPGSGRLG
jgi:hypothetical protein